MSTPINTIGRILHDLEHLECEPSYVARQSRRLRGLIERVTGRPVPEPQLTEGEHA